MMKCSLDKKEKVKKNLKNKSSMIALIVLLTMMTGGCSDSNEPIQTFSTYEAVNVDNQFMCIEALDGRIYIDKETLCQYYFVKIGYGAGFTLLVNPDGTPKLYEGEIK